MEDYEQLQKALAEFVVWARGEVICPFHHHVTVALVTKEGIADWHGPICMASPDEQRILSGQFVFCEFLEKKKELVEEAIQVLGSTDMSNFL